jgi:uncharacterized ubiquitin-like protein YukD
MNNEFVTLTTEEKAEVISEMVIDIAIETGLPIDVCIAIVAEYKGWSRFQVEKYIKIHDDTLLYQVAFYDGEKRVYKYQIDAEVKECLINKLLDIVTNNPFEVSASWLRKVIQEYCYKEGF